MLKAVEIGSMLIADDAVENNVVKFGTEVAEVGLALCEVEAGAKLIEDGCKIVVEMDVEFIS